MKEGEDFQERGVGVIDDQSDHVGHSVAGDGQARFVDAHGSGTGAGNVAVGGTGSKKTHLVGSGGPKPCRGVDRARWVALELGTELASQLVSRDRSEPGGRGTRIG